MSTNEYIDIFEELGRRLSKFGADSASEKAINGAVADNMWFTEADILFSARALGKAMLQREILSRWLGAYSIRYGAPKDVAVIMAGNIPFAGFFDLMCVIVSGNRCFVKTSAKDTVLMEYVIDVLRTIAPEVMIERYEADRAYDAVIASGSDNANRYFRSQFEDVPSLLRGNRSSLAILNGEESQEQLRVLSEDIFTYGGLGCRSVSLIFVPKGYDVYALCSKIAPKSVNASYNNNYRQQKAMLTMSGADFLDGNGFVMVQADVFSDSPSVIHVAEYNSTSEAEQWIDANEERIQCVVSGEGGFLRGVQFGQAQYPYPWDYPDGRDVMKFLTNSENN